MNLLTFNQLYHREYTKGQRVFKIILSLIILIIGGLIYVGYREKSLLMFSWFQQLGINTEIDMFRELVESDGLYGWVKYSLPDGLWLFAYMFLIDSIWNGSKSLASYIFIYSLPFFALLSESMQYWGIVPGVFDGIDVASYLFAIVLFILIKIIK